MGPALSPGAVGQEMAACAVLGGVLGAARAVLPTRGRAAFLPDMLFVGAVLMALQSYAVSQSQAGQLRGYMALAASCAAGAVQAALRPLFAAAEAFAGKLLLGPVRLAGASPRGKPPAPPPKYGGTKKDLQKNRKRACQHHGVCCIIQTYQSESTGALGLLSENGRHCVMANPSRKKRKRKASVVGAVLKLLFLLLLLSMLAAYIANQVALSSKKAELDTLQEQIDQQKTQNEEMQRILSGDSDDVTEWVARDSYNYAAANERIFVDVTGN